MIHNLNEFTANISLTPFGLIVGTLIIVGSVKLAFNYFPRWKRNFTKHINKHWK